MTNIFVKPSKEVDAGNQVAIWEQNREHWDADPKWEEMKCVWIEGSAANPGQVYCVSDTAFVSERIQKGFLKLVEDYTPPAIKVTKVADAPVDSKAK